MVKSDAVFDRDPPAGYDGRFLWDFLRGAFVGRSGVISEPMDFDGVVERYGRFLMFETKTPGAPIPLGQQIVLRSLLRDRRWTVVYCAKRPEDIRGWWVGTHKDRTYHSGDADKLRCWCEAWWQHATTDPLSREREPGEEG